MRSVDFITIALVLIAGKTLAEQCFKVDQTDRKISAEELEKGLIDIVKEWKSYERESGIIEKINSLRSDLSLLDKKSYPVEEMPERPAETEDRVATLLASISDKDTELTCLKGHSVRQLVEMNTELPSDNGLRKAEIKRRQTICNKIAPYPSFRPVSTAIASYCKKVEKSCFQKDVARVSESIKDLFETFTAAAKAYRESHENKIDTSSYDWRRKLAKAVLPKMDREQANELKTACKYLYERFEKDFYKVSDKAWPGRYWMCEEIKSVRLSRS